MAGCSYPSKLVCSVGKLFLVEDVCAFTTLPEMSNVCWTRSVYSNARPRWLVILRHHNCRRSAYSFNFNSCRQSLIKLIFKRKEYLPKCRELKYLVIVCRSAHFHITTELGMQAMERKKAREEMKRKAGRKKEKGRDGRDNKREGK